MGLVDDDQPLVSAVVITRDRPAMFRAALDSVLEQTYSNMEIIVVDGSTEPVEPLVRRRVDGALPVQYRRDDGQGPGAARNLGIRAAEGTFLAFLDDDDRWLPDKIQRQIAAFAPDVGTVHTGQFTVRDGERVGGRTPSLSGTVTEDLLRGATCCPTSTVMVRRELIARAGPFDEALPVWEDREWYIRLSREGEFRSVPAQLVRRDLGDYEHLTDNFEAARDVAYPHFLAKHRPLAVEYGCERALVAWLSRMVAAIGIATGRYADARKFLLRALRHDPFQRGTWLYLLLSLGGRPVHSTAKQFRDAWRTLVKLTSPSR